MPSLFQEAKEFPCGHTVVSVKSVSLLLKSRIFAFTNEILLEPGGPSFQYWLWVHTLALFAHLFPLQSGGHSLLLSSDCPRHCAGLLVPVSDCEDGKQGEQKDGVESRGCSRDTVQHTSIWGMNEAAKDG